MSATLLDSGTDAAFVKIVAGADTLTAADIAKAFDVPLHLLAVKPPKLEYKPIDFTKTIATDQPASYQKFLTALLIDASEASVDTSRIDAELLAGLGLDDPAERRKTAAQFEQADRLLAHDGWCQNTLHQAYEELVMPPHVAEWLTASGVPLTAMPVPERRTRYKHCTLGALAYVAAGRMVERFEPGTTAEREFNRLSLFLSHALGGVPVPAWNDNPNRTASHVHTALQRCSRFLASV